MTQIRYFTIQEGRILKWFRLPKIKPVARDAIPSEDSRGRICSLDYSIL